MNLSTNNLWKSPHDSQTNLSPQLGPDPAVLEALVGGAGTDQIAAQLHMAPTTVKTHLSSIFRKLGVANRTQAVAKALREGLLEQR